MRRWLWIAAGLVVADTALLWLLSYVTATRGLLSPGGSPHPDVVALAIVLVVGRVAVRFLLPAIVFFGASRVAVSRMMRRWG
jgi:hypothetical protein